MGENSVTEIPGVPTWAVNLVQQVAEIRVRVESVPRIERELDEVRKVMIPPKEYEDLAKRVDDLWDTKNNLVPQWQDARPRVDTLWDERAQIRGMLRAQRWLMAGLGFVLSAMTVYLTVRTAGISLHGP